MLFRSGGAGWRRRDRAKGWVRLIALPDRSGISAAFDAAMAGLGPFEPRPRVAVGVSGGADSSALALLTDRVIAADTAVFSLPEIDINIPTFLGISMVTRAGGAALASDLVMSGRRMSAAEAQARALIAEVVPAADRKSTRLNSSH